uniref:Uncharacterized protein n=1 Tax=Romanomermis culicivorax TaxID=13658 RepID=A0A915KKI5_ROMCU
MKLQFLNLGLHLKIEWLCEIHLQENGKRHSDALCCIGKALQFTIICSIFAWQISRDHVKGTSFGVNSNVKSPSIKSRASLLTKILNGADAPSNAEAISTAGPIILKEGASIPRTPATATPLAMPVRICKFLQPQ